MSSTRDTLLNLGSLAGAVMIMVDASWFSFFLYLCVALGMVFKNYESQGKVKQPVHQMAEDIRKAVLDVDKSSEDEEPVEKSSMVPERNFPRDFISTGDKSREGRSDSLPPVPDEPATPEDVKEIGNIDVSGQGAEDVVAKGESVLSKVQNLLRRSSSKSSTSSVDSDEEKEATPPEEPMNAPREKASCAAELLSAPPQDAGDVSKPLNIDESNDVPEVKEVPAITLNQEKLPVDGDEATRNSAELASKPVDSKEADEFEAKPPIDRNGSSEISSDQGIDMHAVGFESGGECLSSSNTEHDADVSKRDDNPSGKEDGERAYSNVGKVEQGLEVTERPNTSRSEGKDVPVIKDPNSAAAATEIDN